MSLDVFESQKIDVDEIIRDIMRLCYHVSKNSSFLSKVAGLGGY